MSVHLFYYAPVLRRPEKKLLDLMAKSFPEAHLEVFSTAADLALRLIRPRGGASIAVIVPGGGDDLEEIHHVRNMISDTAILVLLPDEDEEGRARARRLRPQYIGLVGRDTAGVISVMDRMANARWSRRNLP